MTTVFPHYNAPCADCLFGVVIHNSGGYSYSHLFIDNVQVQEVAKDLSDKFGITPAVYLSSDVT